jgi:hypothetical protein
MSEFAAAFPLFALDVDGWRKKHLLLNMKIFTTKKFDGMTVSTTTFSTITVCIMTLTKMTVLHNYTQHNVT